MSKKMFLVLIGIVSLMLSIVLIEITGLSVFDAYLSSRGLNISITIDGIPPDVVIISPENLSYSNENVLLNYSITDSLTPIGTIWYNLNNGTNTTVTAPGLINALEGTHTLYLYANDSVGNMNSSYVSFNTTKAVTPPSPPSDEPEGRVGPFKEEKNVTNVTVPPEEVPPEEILPDEVSPAIEEIQEIIRKVEFDKVRIYLGIVLIIFLIFLLYYYMRNKHWFFFIGKRRKKDDEEKTRKN